MAFVFLYNSTKNEVKMLKSPLRYPGGKNRVADMLLKNMPDFKEYREPFIGGASVMIRTKQEYPDKGYWINDLYYDLFCFWEQIANDRDGVISQIEAWRNEYKGRGKELHRFLVDNMTMFSPREKAAAFFILNRITFSGTSLSGGYSNSAYESRFTDSSIQRAKDISKLLDGVKITNEDYAVLMDAPGEDVFVFLDPPYYSATDSALYGKNGELHKGFDHERFAETCKRCKHKWMITYDDCEYIRNLYKDYKIVPFEFAYGMRNVTENADMKGKEILIINY